MTTLVSRLNTFAHAYPDNGRDSSFSGVWPRFTQPELWESAAREDNLSMIAALPDDWDGCGSASVSRQAIIHSRAILSTLSAAGSAPDQILPSPAGTVLFDWETDFGTAHLELGKSTFGFYTSPTVGRPIMNGGEIDDLDVDHIRAALATIEPTVNQLSLAVRVNPLGF